MRSAAELKLLRAQTKAFIADNQVELTLIPRERITSGQGTTFQDQPAREPQIMRLLDQSTSRNTWPGMIQTADGRERLTDFILLAEHDAKVKEWDYWTDTTGTWEIIEVYPSNDYEIRASVVRRG